jgi:DNA-directed RNA polymerase subunit RPC12/RpoP
LSYTYTRYSCGKCGATVAKDAGSCHACGVGLMGIRCASCGHRWNSRSELDSCPRCGRRAGSTGGYGSGGWDLDDWLESSWLGFFYNPLKRLFSRSWGWDLNKWASSLWPWGGGEANQDSNEGMETGESGTENYRWYPRPTKAQLAKKRLEGWTANLRKVKKAASIRRIDSIEPIPGAFYVDVALIDGVPVVVPKDEYCAGDLVVFIRAGTVVPDLPEFSFLEGKGFTVSTVTICGQVSMGLVQPLSILPGEAPREPGANVSSLLGVKPQH